MKIFQGSAVALVTPFDKNGEINFKSFERLLEFHLENNTQAIIIFGTTGERKSQTRRIRFNNRR